MIANVYKTKAEPNYIPANSSRWIDDDLLRRCKETAKKGYCCGIVPAQITMTIPSKWAIILLGPSNLIPIMMMMMRTWWIGSSEGRKRANQWTLHCFQQTVWEWWTTASWSSTNDCFGCQVPLAQDVNDVPHLLLFFYFYFVFPSLHSLLNPGRARLITPWGSKAQNEGKPALERY